MPEKIPQRIDRIAIFRALQLGDMLCAVPALRALKARYPQADITLIGLPGIAELARRLGKYLTSFVSFPGVPGLPEQPFCLDAYTEFLRRERQTNYDLVIQMHGKGTITNSIVSMLSPGLAAGYFTCGEYCPNPDTFMAYPHDIPEVERHVRLMKFLGIEPKGNALEFPVSDDEWRLARELCSDHGVEDNREYVCIHPGARDVRRWWEPKKFAHVADALAARGYTVILTGTSAERNAAESVKARMSQRVVDLVGKTSLGILGAVIARSRLLVSNDTGVSHIAAAFGTPSVVIFLASDPDRWAPLNRTLHRAVHRHESESVENVLAHAERALLNTPDRSRWLA